MANKEAAIKLGVPFALGIALTLFLEHGPLNDSFGERVHKGNAAYMSGQTFTREGLELQTLTKPSRAVLDAVLHGAYKEFGDDSPEKPSPKTRAEVICAAVGATALPITEDIKADWNAIPDLSGDKLLRAYQELGDGCDAVLNANLGKAEIAVPIAED